MWYVITSAVTMVKSHEKKHVKIIFLWRCSAMLPKSEFWKDGYCAYKGKNDGVWLMWRIFKEYLKENIITAVLGKANAHSVAICRLIKELIM